MEFFDRYKILVPLTPYLSVDNFFPFCLPDIPFNIFADALLGMAGPASRFAFSEFSYTPGLRPAPNGVMLLG